MSIIEIPLHTPHYIPTLTFYVDFCLFAVEIQVFLLKMTCGHTIEISEGNREELDRKSVV